MLSASLEMNNARGVTTITATAQPQIIKESQIQPVWHVIVLNALTVGFYAPIWFFKTSRLLLKRAKEELAVASDFSPHKAPVRLADLTQDETDSLDLIKRVPPFFLMLGILLPVINFFLGIFFFKMVAELYPDESSLAHKPPPLIGLALSLLMVGSLCLSRLPHLFFLLYCLGISVPISIAQHLLNAYWRSIELDSDLLVRHSFSTSELVMLILGIVLLGLIVAGFAIAPMQPAPVQLH
jgi:hypothetical protein